MPRGESVTQASWEADKAEGLREVLQMLVEGGYYRARISAISDFDKVAGGLAWSIYSSRESIDVEFKENANIGDKMKLGENIEGALTAMQCPHELQAHQVTRLDTPTIKPVLAWLLKRVASVRKEQQASLARHAALLFGRTFGAHPSDVKQEPAVPLPVRKLRRPADEDISTEVSHVSSVLLEYGHTYHVRTDVDIDEAEDDVRAKEQLQKMKEEEERELAAMEQMMSQMSSVKERSKLSSQAVGGLLSQQSEAIAQEAADFTERMNVMRDEAMKGDADLQALLDKKQRLEDREVELRAEGSDVREQHEKAAKDAEKAAKDAGKKARRVQRITDEIQKMQDALGEDAEKKALFNKMMKMLKKADSADEQVESLRDTCQAELQAWRKKVDKMKEKAAEASERGADEGELLQVTEMVEHTKAKFDPFRKVSAELDREIAKLNRQLDAVPTSAELVQYERRFSELYEQASWKYAETQQAYNSYNMLTEKVRYLTKETDLMRSIEKQCTEILNPKEANENKQQLAKTIAEIVGKVVISKSRVSDEVEGDKAQLASKTAEYTKQIEVQRSYLLAIKDLEEEFESHQKLSSKIETMKAALAEAG